MRSRGRERLRPGGDNPHANEGIAQMIFLKADRICAMSYADKGGKYQDQIGLTLPRVDGEEAPKHLED